jgi:hypothetical protein
MGKMSFEYFCFTCQFSFHRLLHTHHLLSSVGTLTQLVADVQSEISLTPPQEANYVQIQNTRPGYQAANTTTHFHGLEIYHVLSQHKPWRPLRTVKHPSHTPATGHIDPSFNEKFLIKKHTDACVHPSNHRKHSAQHTNIVSTKPHINPP